MNEKGNILPGAALLAEADREFDMGNYSQGAGLVWQAAMAALSAAAERHGMPCRNREEARQLAAHLDEVAHLTKSPSSERGSAVGAALAEQSAAGEEEQEAWAFPWNLAGFRLAESFREQCQNSDELTGTEFQWEPEEFAIFLDPVRGFIESLAAKPML